LLNRALFDLKVLAHIENVFNGL